MSTKSSAMGIVSIVRVVDTREYEEVGDKWTPIPGSGLENQCSRCGRSHEVHATVKLQDGSFAVVGTGCMKAESVEIRSEIKKLTSASKRVAKLEAEKSKYLVLIAEKEAIESQVREMSFPGTSERVVDNIDSKGTEYQTYEIFFSDGSSPFVSFSALTERDYERAETYWRGNKAKELGLTYAHTSAAYYLQGTQKAINKIMDKYPELVA